MINKLFHVLWCLLVVFLGVLKSLVKQILRFTFHSLCSGISRVYPLDFTSPLRGVYSKRAHPPPLLNSKSCIGSINIYMDTPRLKRLTLLFLLVVCGLLASRSRLGYTRVENISTSNMELQQSLSNNTLSIRDEKSESFRTVMSTDGVYVSTLDTCVWCIFNIFHSWWAIEIFNFGDCNCIT